MSTRDEINDAVNRFGAEMVAFGRGQRRDYPAAEKQVVLSLIAQPPAPSEAGRVTPEMIERGGRAIWDNAFPGQEWDAGLKEIYCKDARLALAAALARRPGDEQGEGA